VTPAPAIAQASAAPAAGAEPVLTRRELDAALANFSALTVAFRAAFTPEGVKVESVLDGSVFAKAGLRAGDVIASVEGRPLRSLDDVAALYARAGSLRAVTAQVVRGGKLLTLRVSIQ
jgi:S1-C subfamily serine protease